MLNCCQPHKTTQKLTAQPSISEIYKMLPLAVTHSQMSSSFIFATSGVVLDTYLFQSNVHLLLQLPPQQPFFSLNTKGAFTLALRTGFDVHRIWFGELTLNSRSFGCTSDAHWVKPLLNWIELFSANKQTSCQEYIIVAWYHGGMLLKCIVKAESRNEIAAGWTDEETKSLPCDLLVSSCCFLSSLRYCNCAWASKWTLLWRHATQCLHGETLESRHTSIWHDTYTPHHVSIQFACSMANVNAIWCASNWPQQDANWMHIQNVRGVKRPWYSLSFMN